MSDAHETIVECPAKFYKYKPMDEISSDRVKRIICNNEIFFAPATTFNDPFDLRPVFSLNATERTKRKDYERLVKKFEPSLSRRERRAESRKVIAGPLRKENMVDLTETMQKQFADFLTTQIGILSVSTKNDDILMWAHYADSHRGVCLEFDGSFAFMAHSHRVAYSIERRPINQYLDDNDTALQKVLLTKSEHWRYEDEWRLIRNEGPGLVQFRPHNLTGVIIGAQAGRVTEEYIKEWATQRTTPISIYKASASNSTYSLDIRPLP